MPQSLARLHVHLIFSTKNREPLLLDTVRDSRPRDVTIVIQCFGDCIKGLPTKHP